MIVEGNGLNKICSQFSNLGLVVVIPNVLSVVFNGVYVPSSPYFQIDFLTFPLVMSSKVQLEDDEEDTDSETYDQNPDFSCVHTGLLQVTVDLLRQASHHPGEHAVDPARHGVARV